MVLSKGRRARGSRHTTSSSILATTNHYLLEPTKHKRCIPQSCYNAAQLACVTCKGFKQYGICSHVNAIKHLLGNYELEDELKELSQKHKKGELMKRVRSALVREREADFDSTLRRMNLCPTGCCRNRRSELPA